MIHSKSFRTAALLVGALLAAACSEQTTSPKPLRSLAPQSKAPAGNVIGTEAGALWVCAEGPAGTYNYTMSITATTKNGVVTPLGTSFSLTDGQCAKAVYLTLSPDFAVGSETDPPTSVVLTQVSAPANTKLDYLQKTEETNQAACTPGDTFPCGLDTQESGPATTVIFNWYHGSVVSYWNEEIVTNITGCTLTQGYWKNHTSNWPSPYSPNDAFFTSGKSWIQILSTPPKNGNAYLILAHQYIAATLNVAAGASMPADVQAAYNSATTYFQTGVGSDPIGWATILDNYNNGLAAGGPAHCS